MWLGTNFASPIGNYITTEGLQIMSLNAKAIGRKIQEARLAKGLTQNALAKLMGIDRSSVVRWETGVSVPRQVGVPRLAKALGKDPSWLLEGSSQITDPQAHGLEILKAEKRTLKEIRSEMKRLGQKLRAARTPSSEHSPVSQIQVERKALEQIIGAWDSAKPEARLVAALLITGDWAYKLKLLNREVSVEKDVLAVLGRQASGIRR